jgi:hypothetical protein
MFRQRKAARPAEWMREGRIRREVFLDCSSLHRRSRLGQRLDNFGDFPHFKAINVYAKRVRGKCLEKYETHLDPPSQLKVSKVYNRFVTAQDISAALKGLE